MGSEETVHHLEAPMVQTSGLVKVLSQTVLTFIKVWIRTFLPSCDMWAGPHCPFLQEFHFTNSVPLNHINQICGERTQTDTQSHRLTHRHTLTDVPVNYICYRLPLRLTGVTVMCPTLTKTLYSMPTHISVWGYTYPLVFPFGGTCSFLRVHIF